MYLSAIYITISNSGETSKSNFAPFSFPETSKTNHRTKNIDKKSNRRQSTISSLEGIPSQNTFVIARHKNLLIPISIHISNS